MELYDIKYPFLIPQCDNLTLIVNKAALSLILLPDSNLSEGCPLYRPFDKDCISSYLKFAHFQLTNHDYKFLSRFFVFNDKLDRFEYIFSLVKCGKCLKCRHTRVVDFINRVKMESACYDSPCVMVTLTYAPAYLPMHRVRGMFQNSLYYPDIQRFFKRLRIRWSRQGLSHNIRYLVCGEYGKKGRPHYHLLIWNNPYHCGQIDSPFMASRNFLLFRKFYDDVFKAWGMCEPQAFQCEPAGDGAGAYVSKYLLKQIAPFKYIGKCPPFIHQSSAAGGIGAPMVTRYKDYFLRNPHKHEFFYRSYDGAVITQPITSFIKNKVFPSASRQIPNHYKMLFRSLVHLASELIDYGLMSLEDARQCLDVYRLGVLSYDLKIFDREHQPSPVYDWILERLQFAFESLIEELDDNLFYDVDLTAYNIHRQTCVPVDDARGNFSFDIFRYRKDNYVHLSKQVL